MMVHATLLPTGKVLFWEAAYPPPPGQPAHGNRAAVWDPSAGTGSGAFAEIDPPAPNGADPNNIFCSGHVVLPGGRVLITGGQNAAVTGNGLAYTNIFDSFANAWWTGAQPPNMNYARWYPTNTPLWDGTVLTLSGTDQNGAFVPTPELWQPNTTGTGTWLPLNGVGGSNTIGGAPGSAQYTPYYPWTYQDPRPSLNNQPGHDNQVYIAGPSMYADDLETAATNQQNNGRGYWLMQGPDRDNANTSYHFLREYGSSVMYSPGKILVVGGKVHTTTPGIYPTETAEAVDLTAPSPAWQQVASMLHGRKYMNATMLPDGKVLATGGTGADCFNENNETGYMLNGNFVYPPVIEGEIWNPSAPNTSWTRTAFMASPRLYHSIALLLPDASVLVAGGGEGGSCGGAGYDFQDHPTAQIYSPPYLFQPGDRPQIGGMLSNNYSIEIHYGQYLHFWVQGNSIQNNSDHITQVSLVRLPSVTHSFNYNQWFKTYLDPSDPRLNGVYADPNDANAPVITRHHINASDLGVMIPNRPQDMPPGYYMLFAVSDTGVPSVAKIIWVTDPNNRNDWWPY